jgi:hypothetical protein
MLSLLTQPAALQQRRMKVDMRPGRQPGMHGPPALPRSWRGAPELAVRVPGAQQHKLAALLHSAVHRVPDQVDALRAGAGSAAVAAHRDCGAAERQRAGHLLRHQARNAGHNGRAGVRAQAQAQLQVPACAHA